MAAEAKRTAEGIAFSAALCSNRAHFAGWAFVHGVLGELPTALQFSPQRRDVSRRGSRWRSRYACCWQMYETQSWR